MGEKVDYFSGRGNRRLIVSAIPETACQTDSAALAVVIEDLKANGFEPTELLADTAYGGDENHSRCLDEGIDLITPTPGKCPDQQTASERFDSGGLHGGTRREDRPLGA
jgi:hypothetical protein